MSDDARVTEDRIAALESQTRHFNSALNQTSRVLLELQRDLLTVSKALAALKDESSMVVEMLRKFMIPKDSDG